MNILIIEKYIILALNELMEKEHVLLKNNVHERAISYKLGTYIEKYFPSYNIDCEYDRNAKAIEDKKIIYEIECEYGEKKSMPKKIIPDIIIHQREENYRNLVIIEIKKSCSKKTSQEQDEVKLKAATTKVLSNLGYKYGLFILIGVKEDIGSYQLIWYENGVKTREVDSKCLM
ncbi:hypothetical protein [Vallitalea guaymasensis]|uniref:Uncharacterized protein n=1 Tax=Vallitalea guaymasensis TaxID=1185412 RepID=A0A8J8SAL3_9FIRM|nr:hypothetical protein [Vallitalea guaymasensis]QUH27787.1 hypothetical protein HYG85_02195 [Vallitalea guaymasensis]